MISFPLAYKQKFPDRKAPYGIPYEGIENLRPETKKLTEFFMMGLPKK
jgi:hypothetical protein